MRLRLFVAAFLALPLCLSAHADSFVSYNLTSDEGREILGIDANGKILIDVQSGPSDTYQIYQDGSLLSSSKVLPSFVAQNGAQCAAPAGAGAAICSGGREVYDSAGTHGASFYLTSPGSSDPGELMYQGYHMVNPIVSPAGVIFAALNESGDFVYIDQLNENIVEVTSAVTPEPSSFLLMGTGLLGVIGAIKRRYA